MTVIIDPFGMPEAVPVRDGVAVINLVGGGGPATEIPAAAGTVIVIAQSPNPGTPGDPGSFDVSPDFAIGEAVEVYAESDFAFSVALPSGETTVFGSGSVSGSLATPIRLLKVKATKWVAARFVG